MVTFLLLNAILWIGTLLIATAIRPRGLDRVLATSILGFTIIVISLILLSALGELRLPFVALVSLVVLLLGLALQFKRGGIRGVSRALQFRLSKHFDLATLALAAFSLWAALHYLLQGLVWPVAPISDAPIYHLPFALRWWHVGTMEFVPTPFGEEAATYFPANGDLWLTWLSVTSSGGPIIKVGQWPFLVLGTIALFALGRQLGGTRSSSMVPATCWCVSPVALAQSSLANVDLIWTAYYFIGLYYLVRFSRQLRRGKNALGEAVLLGLSLGIVLGTKSIGILFVPLLLTPALFECWRWSIRGSMETRRVSEGYKRGTKAAAIHTCLLTAGLVLMSAYWFLRNMWWTGNPIYPLNVAPFGVSLLPGWYTRAAMMNTTYHIPSWRLDILASMFLITAGVIPALLWCGSMLGYMLGIFNHRLRHWSASSLALLALILLMLYWIVIPYNTQERFLLPCLGIGLLPLAIWVKRWPSLMPLISVAIVVHLLLVAPGSPMSVPILPLPRNSLTLGTWWATASLPLSLMVAAAVWHRRWLGSITALLALVSGSYFYAYPATQMLWAQPNNQFYPHGGFAERMNDAWLTVERMSDQQGSTVAYTGTNLPYYLYGRLLRNNVVYVAVNNHPEWLPHDYHQERTHRGDFVLSENPWPQLYRRDANYNAWLTNLRSANIQLLFVARENQHGRKSTSNGLPPFPIEKQWADSHPESFEVLGSPKSAESGIEWVRVYRLLLPK